MLPKARTAYALFLSDQCGRFQKKLGIANKQGRMHRHIVSSGQRVEAFVREGEVKVGRFGLEGKEAQKRAR